MTDRIETDSFGDIAVPDARLWGAQTQRSMLHFAISSERMPNELLIALAQVKRACAAVNCELGLLQRHKAGAILAAADEVIAGLHADEFPLSVWQTGSGTQTHMNMNEVLANRGSELLGGQRGTRRLLHPNDDINLGQSSNDVFPTAMHVATVCGIQDRLLPALSRLKFTLTAKAHDYMSLVKIGRTHLQDATPVTLGQELSGQVAQLDIAEQAIRAVLPLSMWLAIGGTAVGTGLNTHPEFGARVAQELSKRTGLSFRSADNKFAALAGHEPLVALHGSLKTLACALIKLSNDLRWLASGPRCGLSEISLPENEPGSSIMPGKVNPTQAEAMLMLCYQVIGNDTTIAMAGCSGNFELNVAKPVLAYAVLQSLRLLTDGINSLETHCIRGLIANEQRIAEGLQRSLMLVTALTPHIGYDKAAQIAKYAHAHQLSLREAAVHSGQISGEQFDRWVRPEAMLAPNQV
jgi:fumarate hydratase class II